MSQHYIFNEVGIIPGIPGSFANVRVDIDEAGEVSISPLSVHPAFVPSGQEEMPPQEEQATVPEETPVEHLEALEQEVQEAIAEVEHPEQQEPTPPPA